MTKIIDFSNCELSPRNLEYGGRAGEKKGIIYNNSFWFLKFPKNTNGMDNVKGLSYVTSPLSEYIGSHIYKILGYDVHETLLGICFDGKRNKVVCACKDFINDDKNELLIPYTALRNDTNPAVMNKRDSSSFSASNIDEIIFQLDNNTVLGSIKEAKERFWDVVVIDLLINNNDRNEDNWGVIKFKKENKYTLAPVFDCGNCFYGKTSEQRIDEILASKEKLLSSAINGITAYEDSNDKRIRNFDILKINNDDLKKSIIRVSNKIFEHLNEIISFINGIPLSFNEVEIMSEKRKRYYISTMIIRWKNIILPSMEHNNDLVLPKKDWDFIMKLISDPGEPNEALIDLMKENK